MRRRKKTKSDQQKGTGDDERLSLHHFQLDKRDRKNETIDPCKVIFTLAVERNYPFAKPIFELYKIEKTIEFLQKQHFLKEIHHNVCTLKTYDETGQWMDHDCCTFINTQSLSKHPFYKEKHNGERLRKNITEMGYTNDVFVCISHPEYFHRCSGRSCRNMNVMNRIQNETQCPISHKRIKKYTYNPYVNTNYSFCGLPGSSVHGIFQARVLEWGAIAFSRVILYPLPNVLPGAEGP